MIGHQKNNPKKVGIHNLKFGEKTYFMVKFLWILCAENEYLRIHIDLFLWYCFTSNDTVADLEKLMCRERTMDEKLIPFLGYYDDLEIYFPDPTFHF